MRIERIEKPTAARVRIPQLAGVSYRFEPGRDGRAFADVGDGHAPFFLAHQARYRAVTADGKPIKAAPPSGSDSYQLPVVEEDQPEHVRNGARGDRVDQALTEKPVEDLSNADLIAWAARRNVPWRNRRLVAKWALDTLGLALDSGIGSPNTHTMLRRCVAAERRANAPAPKEEVRQ